MILVVFHVYLSYQIILSNDEYEIQHFGAPHTCSKI